MSNYTLRPKSGGWTTHPDAHSPDYRLLRFDMTVTYRGRRLGGNNIQVVVGAPDQTRRGHDKEVALWLQSGWWVALRNQFAQAPDIAVEVLESVADELSAITTEAMTARGVSAETVTQKLFSITFDAIGPEYSR